MAELLEYGANVFRSRFGAYTKARLYQREGLTSFVHYDREKGEPDPVTKKRPGAWVIELGVPGPLDKQLIASQANRGARVFMGTELPERERLEMEFRQLGIVYQSPDYEYGARSDLEYGTQSDLVTCARSVHEATDRLNLFRFQLNDTSLAFSNVQDDEVIGIAKELLVRSKQLLAETKEGIRDVAEKCDLAKSLAGFPIGPALDQIERDLNEGEYSADRLARRETFKMVERLDANFTAIALRRILDLAMR